MAVHSSIDGSEPDSRLSLVKSALSRDQDQGVAIMGLDAAGSIEPARADRASGPAGGVSRISLSWARSVVVDRLRVSWGQVASLIIARVHEEAPDSLLDEHPELIAGLAQTVEAVIDFCLACVARGRPLVGGVPDAALEQVRQAARLGVGLDVIVCRYDVGARVLWAFVVDEIRHAGFSAEVRCELLAEAVAMQAALLGRFHRAVATEHAREAGSAPRRVTTAKLTPREIEVHALLSLGRTNREIAEELHLSVPTVCKHVAHMLQKAGVSSRHQLADMEFVSDVGEGRVICFDYSRPPVSRPSWPSRYPPGGLWRSPAAARSRGPSAVRRAA